MHTIYILHSTSLDRYYCGETSDFKDRLRRHNSGYSKATKAGRPWQVVRLIEVQNRAKARILEKRIKARGIGRWLDEN